MTGNNQVRLGINVSNGIQQCTPEADSTVLCTWSTPTRVNDVSGLTLVRHQASPGKLLGDVLADLLGSLSLVNRRVDLRYPLQSFPDCDSTPYTQCYGDQEH